jgi:hypothetical protein
LVRTIGYARVSADDQGTALQLDALRVTGCAEIFEDNAAELVWTALGSRVFWLSWPVTSWSFDASTAWDAHFGTSLRSSKYFAIRGDPTFAHRGG